jgi:hypothetical protein
MKIGLNILGGGNYNEPALLAWLDRALPSACVVMDNSDLALRLQARYPDMMVIYRAWPDDNIPTIHIDAWAWVEWIASYVPDERILLYAGNEPSADERLADWTIDAMSHADTIGRRLIGPNPGMGGPEDWEWRTIMPQPALSIEMHLAELRRIRDTDYQALKPYLMALHVSNRWRKTNGLEPHVVGVHEYFDFHDWRYPGYDPLAGQNWLIGRFRRMWDACDEMGLDRPPVLITEHGSDSLSAPYHGWLAGDAISQPDYAAALMDMDTQVYNDPLVLGQTIFCWNGHDTGWSTFDISNAPTLLDTLAAYAEAQREAGGDEDMDIEWTQRRVIVTTPVNRRVSYGTTARLLNGQMAVGDYVLDVGLQLDDGGYTWHQFRDGTGFTWWSASGHSATPNEWMTVTDYAPPVEPPDEPPVDPPDDPQEPPFDAALFVLQWQTFLDAMNKVLQAFTVAITAQQATLRTMQGEVNQVRAILQETREDAADLVDNDEQEPPMELVA